MSEIKDMIKQIPPFTRYFLGTTLAISFGMTYRILDAYWLILDLELAFKKLNLWRFITTFLFMGPFSQNFLFSMIMAYFSLRRVEEYY